MKPTFEELSKLMEAEEKEKQRVSMALHLGICPECGAEIVTKTKPYEIGWWIFKSKETLTYNTCKDNEEHYYKLILDTYFDNMDREYGY